MKFKDITLKLRTEGHLRGEKPCVVVVPKNNGKLYSGKNDETYVMTITKDRMLYFHGLSRWFKEYEPKKDFRLKLDGIKSYTKDKVNKVTDLYTFSTSTGLYFPIKVVHSMKGTYETDVNLSAVLRKIKSYGIKEDKLGE